MPSSPDVKNASHNTHENFVFVPIDKATGHITLLLLENWDWIITHKQMPDE